MDNPKHFGISIASVERETGFSKDTLRVWERRYGFPSPARDAFGERAYPPDQVEKLRLIKTLIDRGHRPGKIVGAEMDVLRRMAALPSMTDPSAPDAYTSDHDLSRYITLCKAHRADELRSEMNQSLLRLGMYRFVTEVIAPLTAHVGTKWAAGTLAVFEEHLYTECVQTVMRYAIASILAPGTRLNAAPSPRIILTTVPHEPHGLGLLMAEAIFTLEGAHCVSLGVQTPVTEIAQAAVAQAADIVALSFSRAARPAQVRQALEDLRTVLPSHIEVWAGGRCVALGRLPPALVRQLDLHGISEALVQWRNRNAAP